ncbi:unnamed protein product [Allacma fusca]|uniref:Proteasome assembly chaperone 3 n=1 Tax=Allacma fusca TaxID=39272 RepID=A0A8J2K4R5_9HEXA|nr:unnamed protein product [Allacma fusca]
MSPVAVSAVRNPVEIKSEIFEINSLQTEITIQDFSNRSLIFISQCEGRLGTFLEVTQDKPDFDTFDPSTNTLTIKTFFGVDTEEVELAARIFAGALNISKPLIISIALKDFSKDNLFAIRDSLKKLALE